MNLLIKSLSVLATGGILAGTAFAGPNDAYAGAYASRTPINTKPVRLADIFHVKGLTLPGAFFATKNTSQKQTTIGVYQTKEKKSRTSKKEEFKQKPASKPVTIGLFKSPSERSTAPTVDIWKVKGLSRAGEHY
jgi:hypothetical protein